MKAKKAAFIVAAALACGCAQAAPVVQATLTLGNNTQGIATDPVAAVAFVTNFNDGTVSVIDINTLAVVATVPVGASPRRIIVDAATGRGYVTNSTTPGTVTVGATRGPAFSATIPVGNDPRGITSNFFIGEVYVANNASNSISVISTATNSVIATIPVGNSPNSPTSNDILKKLYVTNSADNTVSAIDETKHTVLKTIPVGKGPITPAIDAEHSKVYVNNVTDKTVSVIDSITDTVIAIVPSGQGQSGAGGATANFVTVNGVYHRAYLPNAIDGTLTIINTDTDTVTHTVPVGTTPVDAIVDANGGNVYVVNQGSNSVSILNAATETVIDNLSVGGAPWRIADGLSHLFVLNTNGAATDSVTIAAEENTIADTAIATEFYHAVFNHYFHTEDEVETRVLLDGLFGDDWHRTFEFFRVWTTLGPGRLPVSRFFSTQWGTKSSHFFTANKAERDALVAGTIPGWQLEADGVYYIMLADGAGNCPAGTAPLYRLYNNGQGGAPNHRFTGNRAKRDLMLAQGWIGEGSGPDTVYGCTPTLLFG